MGLTAFRLVGQQQFQHHATGLGRALIVGCDFHAFRRLATAAGG